MLHKNKLSVKKCLLLGIAMFYVGGFTQTLTAQIVVNQVIIANGGVYEFYPPYQDYVTVASYVPETGIITVFDTIFTQAVQDVVIKDNYAFVSAKDSIVKYNIDNYTRAGAIAVSGLNQMAIYENQLIVGRQWGAEDGIYVKVYDTDSLSFLYAVPEVSDETFGIVVIYDTAYVAVPGGWASTVGKLAVIDLQNQTFVREVSFDSLGQGMRTLFTDGNKIYSLNSMYYNCSYGVFADYDIFSMQTNTYIIDIPVGNGIALNNNTLYCVLNGNIGSYNIYSHEVIDTTLIDATNTIAEAVFDTINMLFYVNYTDYSSFGEGIIYNIQGDSVGSYNIGISAEAMAIDYKDISSISENPFISFPHIFPNPADDIINIHNDNLSDGDVLITDITGKIVYKYILEKNCQKNVNIPISPLSEGLYFIHLRTGDKNIMGKFVKN